MGSKSKSKSKNRSKKSAPTKPSGNAGNQAAASSVDAVAVSSSTPELAKTPEPEMGMPLREDQHAAGPETLEPKSDPPEGQDEVPETDTSNLAPEPTHAEPEEASVANTEAPSVPQTSQTPYPEDNAPELAASQPPHTSQSEASKGSEPEYAEAEHALDAGKSDAQDDFFNAIAFAGKKFGEVNTGDHKLQKSHADLEDSQNAAMNSSVSQVKRFEDEENETDAFYSSLNGDTQAESARDEQSEEAAGQPAETSPAETPSAEAQLAEAHLAEAHLAEAHLAEAQPRKSEPVEPEPKSEPVESTSAESEPGLALSHEDEAEAPSAPEASQPTDVSTVPRDNEYTGTDAQTEPLDAAGDHGRSSWEAESAELSRTHSTQDDSFYNALASAGRDVRGNDVGANKIERTRRNTEDIQNAAMNLTMSQMQQQQEEEDQEADAFYASLKDDDREPNLELEEPNLELEEPNLELEEPNLELEEPVDEERPQFRIPHSIANDDERADSDVAPSDEEPSAEPRAESVTSDARSDLNEDSFYRSLHAAASGIRSDVNFKQTAPVTDDAALDNEGRFEDDLHSAFSSVSKEHEVHEHEADACEPEIPSNEARPTETISTETGPTEAGPTEPEHGKSRFEETGPVNLAPAPEAEAAGDIADDEDDDFYQALTPAVKEETAPAPAPLPVPTNIELDLDDDFLEDDSKPEPPAAGTANPSRLSFLDSDEDLLPEDEPEEPTSYDPSNGPAAGEAATSAAAAAAASAATIMADPAQAPTPQLKPRPSIAEFHTEQKGFDLPMEILPQQRKRHQAPRVVSRTGTPRSDLAQPASPSAMAPAPLANSAHLANSAPPRPSPAPAKAARAPRAAGASSKYTPSASPATVPPPGAAPPTKLVSATPPPPAFAPPNGFSAEVSPRQPIPAQAPPVAAPPVRTANPDPFGFPGLEQAAPRQRPARAASSRGPTPSAPNAAASVSAAAPPAAPPPAGPPVAHAPPRRVSGPPRAVRQSPLPQASPYAPQPHAPPSQALEPSAPVPPGPYAPGSYAPGPYAPGPYTPGPYTPGPYAPGPGTSRAAETIPSTTESQVPPVTVNGEPQAAAHASAMAASRSRYTPSPVNLGPTQSQGLGAAGLGAAGLGAAGLGAAGLGAAGLGAVSARANSVPDQLITGQLNGPHEQGSSVFDAVSSTTISGLPLPLISAKGPQKNKKKDLEKWLHERIVEHQGLPGSLLYKVLGQVLATESVGTKSGPTEAQAEEGMHAILQEYKSNLRLATVPTPATSSDSVITAIFGKLTSENRDEALKFALDNRAYAHALFIANTMGPEQWRVAAQEFVAEEVRQAAAPLAFLYRALAAETEEAGQQAIAELKPKGESSLVDFEKVDSYLVHWAECAATLYTAAPAPAGKASPQTSSAGRQAALRELGKLLVERKFIEEGHVCFVLSRTQLGSCAEFMFPLVVGEEPATFDSYVIAEIYEFTLGRGTPFLLPHKLRFAALLADAGHSNEGLRVAEVVAQVLKSTRGAPQPLIDEAAAIVERCASAAPAPSGGWLQRKLSRPTIEKAISSKFNKFVSGEDEADDAPTSNGSQQGVPLQRPQSASATDYETPFGGSHAPEFVVPQRQSYTPGPDLSTPGVPGTQVPPSHIPSSHIPSSHSRPISSLSARPAPLAEVDEESSSYSESVTPLPRPGTAEHAGLRPQEYPQTFSPVQAQPGYAPQGYPQAVPQQHAYAQTYAQSYPAQPQLQPQQAYPAQAYSQSPQPGLPQPDLPQPGYSQPGYSQPGYSQPGYPQPEFPQPGYPGYPQQHAYAPPYAGQGLPVNGPTAQGYAQPYAAQNAPAAGPGHDAQGLPQLYQQQYQQQPVSVHPGSQAAQAPPGVYAGAGQAPVPAAASAPSGQQPSLNGPSEVAPQAEPKAQEPEKPAAGDSKEKSEEKAKSEDDGKKRGGWFSWLKKDDPNKPVQVKLGNKSSELIYDKETKRWYQKGGPKPEPKKGPPPPPKAAAPAAPAAPSAGAPPAGVPGVPAGVPAGIPAAAPGPEAGSAPVPAPASAPVAAPGPASPSTTQPATGPGPGAAPPARPPVAGGLDDILAASASAGKNKRRPARSRYVSTTATGMPEGLK